MGGDSFAIMVLLASFFIMIFLRFPIAYAVALSSVLCLLSQGLPLSAVCQQMVKGISSFSLMAVPFFIVMGSLMGTGGISEKLIALANACVGWKLKGLSFYGKKRNRKKYTFCVVDELLSSCSDFLDVQSEGNPITNAYFTNDNKPLMQ